MSTDLPDPTGQDLDIGLRLARARHYQRMSQAALGKSVKLSRDQVANIERGRTVLKFSVGWAFCQKLNIDPYFLATGEAPDGPFRAVKIDDLGATDEPFRHVCLGQLRERLQLRRRLVRSLKSFDAAADELADSYEDALARLLRVVLLEVPDFARVEFIEFLAKSTRNFVKNIPPEIRESENKLTDASTSSNLDGVKPRTLKDLLARLNYHTKDSGKKTELADALKVPLETVSRWLSGKMEPSGEATLKLLKWVEQHER
jgi:transcriptional regulator with XRE-family HTH domain